ncbi:hypothetical protein [Streptomyces hydrogenans]|uniref:hypothetical protein n=1 Tax=Streptomyces hydrogenans TaxID=1873719 RepID=UPI00167EC6A1|nr:hypothetical protein [Streptomyces hydrogenans]
MAAELRVVENQLPDWLEAEMDDAIDPVVRRVKAAALRVDVQGGPAGHTGLRGRVASGVGVRKGVSTKGSAYFRIFSEMNTNPERPIPRGMDTEKGWRHPLFGNRDFWFQSRPVRSGWFTDTIGDSGDDIEARLARALDFAINRLG